MRPRLRLAIWLSLTSLAWGLAGFMAFVALGMSAMIFTSDKALRDPWAWALVAGLVMLVLLAASGLLLQWILFASKKDKAARWVSVIPLLGCVVLTSSALPLPWNVDVSGTHNVTFNPDDFPHGDMTFRVHAPGLDPDASLHLSVYPYIEGESRWGLPMRHVEGADWEITFPYALSHMTFNYNLGDRRHAPMLPDGRQRPNAGLRLTSDTLLFDTIAGWLDAVPRAAHSSGISYGQFHHASSPVGLPSAPPDTVIEATFQEPRQAP